MEDKLLEKYKTGYKIQSSSVPITPSTSFLQASKVLFVGEVILCVVCFLPYEVADLILELPLIFFTKLQYIEKLNQLLFLIKAI